MYASIIPAVKMPRGFREFDYEVPEALLDNVERGHLVVIPWRNQPVIGLVMRLSETPSKPGLRLKPITRLLLPHAVPEDVTRLFEWLPDHSFSSPGLCLRSFLPNFTKKTLTTGIQRDQKPPTWRKTSRKLVCTASVYRSAEQKLELIESIAVAATKKNRGVLILAPHQSDVRAIARHLKGRLQTPVGKILGPTGTKSFRDAWLAALYGETPIVVGTRPAAGMPINRLGTIVVVESDSRDHRQYDQNPRFDARELALQRSKTTGAEVHLLSHAPRPEDFLAAGTLKTYSEKTAKPNAELILVNVSRQEKSGSPISNSSHRWIAKALQAGEKVLIFHNRLGSAMAVVCRDCGKPVRCKKCEIAMRQHGSRLECHRCRSVQATPDTCENCHGTSLRTVGSGSTGLAEFLRQEYPNAKIRRIDSIEQTTDADSADITIGTQLAIHELSELPELADGITTVIATDTDELLNHPGFRITEQAWRTITTLRHLAGDGRLILETFDPDNSRLRRLLQAPDEFLKEELTVRKETGYPPLGNLITVTLADPSEAAGKQELYKLKDELKRLAGPDSVSVSPPLQPNQPYRHGKWRWTIAVRHADASNAVTSALGKLPEQFLVERDPDSIT